MQEMLPQYIFPAEPVKPVFSSLTPVAPGGLEHWERLVGSEGYPSQGFQWHLDIGGGAYSTLTFTRGFDKNCPTLSRAVPRVLAL